MTRPKWWTERERDTHTNTHAHTLHTHTMPVWQKAESWHKNHHCCHFVSLLYWGGDHVTMIGHVRALPLLYSSHDTCVHYIVAHTGNFFILFPLILFHGANLQFAGIHTDPKFQKTPYPFGTPLHQFTTTLCFFV